MFTHIAARALLQETWLEEQDRLLTLCAFAVPLKHAEQLLTTISVPKNRRPKFDLHLKIVDLNNIPYISGSSFVKWHLPHSASAEHHGQTEKYQIREHRVQYHHESVIPIKMVVDKNGMLSESMLYLEVLHEIKTQGKPERLTLGNLKLNLAEYVDADEADGNEDGVCRRYLMQDSKINSTIKICISMRQTEGDRNYSAPPLRVAPVFSGIAGIVAGEQADAEDPLHMPAVNNKAKETGDELRELYRKTVAADWTCQAGEISADKCIEDIFAGGDGWGKQGKGSEGPSHKGGVLSTEDVSLLSDGESRQFHGNKKSIWSQGLFRSRQDMKRHSREHLGKRHQDDMQGTRGVRGRGSFEQQTRQMGAGAERGNNKSIREREDLDVREDLRSWRVPAGSGANERLDELHIL
ncbi:hypothetical protein FKW77_003519 [Venturia effusa]|uniref:C2 NT-type domain-containing protein n=1 Tax=Venturia effusa TaxID=50376 RepID=A0A517LDQ6_9PEZI|nr:hypothetical protein FKW77_003519 [Venturia effusa]